MNHAKRNPGIPKRPNPQKNAKVVLALLWQIRLTGVAEEFFTVRASQGWRPCEDVEDGLPYGGHARLWRRSPDSFFSVPRL